MEHSYFRHLVRDLIIVAGSIFVAIILAKENVFQILIESTDSFVLPTLVAGAFFTSIFTVAPATVSLFAISKSTSPIFVASLAALGGMVVDMVVASFIRNDISKDIGGIARMTFKRHVIKAFHFGFLKWIAFGFGLFLIVTPLPDEFGLLLIGFSKIKTWALPLVLYIAHFAGILALLSIAQKF